MHKNNNKQNNKMATGFEIPFYILGILSIVFLAAGIFSYSRPLVKAADNIPYSEVGKYSYAAVGTQNTYDTGNAVSGEPVFLKLTCILNLDYQFSLLGKQPENLTGYHNLIAIIRDERSGWQRTLQLTPDTLFNGDSYTNQASLDICQILSLVKNVEAETGFQANSYNLEIISNVTIRGKLSGQQFIDTFEHPLLFKFDATRLYLDNPQSSEDPLRKADQKLIPNPIKVNNSIKIMGIELSIKFLRLFTLIGFLCSGIGLAFLAMYLQNMSKHNQVEYLRLKYGSMIVDASISGPDTSKLIIDIKSIEELVIVASKQNIPIFHVEREKKHYYFIQNEGVIYRYTIIGE
jgi:hypothetical protein